MDFNDATALMRLVQAVEKDPYVSSGAGEALASKVREFIEDEAEMGGWYTELMDAIGEGEIDLNLICNAVRGDLEDKGIQTLDRSDGKMGFLVPIACNREVFAAVEARFPGHEPDELGIYFIFYRQLYKEKLDRRMIPEKLAETIHASSPTPAKAVSIKDEAETARGASAAMADNGNHSNRGQDAR